MKAQDHQNTIAVLMNGVNASMWNAHDTFNTMMQANPKTFDSFRLTFVAPEHDYAALKEKFAAKGLVLRCTNVRPHINGIFRECRISEAPKLTVKKLTAKQLEKLLKQSEKASKKFVVEIR